MAYEMDFTPVSTIGLESSPVATALAGLRANEARYFNNKYGQAFVVEAAKKAKKLIDYAHRVLKQERREPSPRDLGPGPCAGHACRTAIRSP